MLALHPAQTRVVAEVSKEVALRGFSHLRVSEPLTASDTQTLQKKKKNQRHPTCLHSHEYLIPDLIKEKQRGGKKHSSRGSFFFLRREDFSGHDDEELPVHSKSLPPV